MPDETEDPRAHVARTLLEALDAELAHLYEGSSTWRFADGDLAHLAPLRTHLAADERAALDDLLADRDDLLADRDDLAARVAEHDDLLADLAEAAATAHARLLADDDFTGDVRTWIREAEADLSPALVAQRTLNRRTDLPDDAPDAAFWQAHRTKALARRRGEVYRKVDALSGDLLRCDETLRRILRPLARVAGPSRAPPALHPTRPGVYDPRLSRTRSPIRPPHRQRTPP